MRHEKPPRTCYKSFRYQKFHCLNNCDLKKVCKFSVFNLEFQKFFLIRRTIFSHRRSEQFGNKILLIWLSNRSPQCSPDYVLHATNNLALRWGYFLLPLFSINFWIPSRNQKVTPLVKVSLVILNTRNQTLRV